MKGSLNFLEGIALSQSGFRIAISRMTPAERNLFITNCGVPTPSGATAASGSGLPHYRGITITLRHATLGRLPLTSDLPYAEISHISDVYIASKSVIEESECGMRKQ